MEPLREPSEVRACRLRTGEVGSGFVELRESDLSLPKLGSSFQQTVDGAAVLRCRAATFRAEIPRYAPVRCSGLSDRSGMDDYLGFGLPGSGPPGSGPPGSGLYRSGWVMFFSIEGRRRAGAFGAGGCGGQIGSVRPRYRIRNARPVGSSTRHLGWGGWAKRFRNRGALDFSDLRATVGRCAGRNHS